MEHPLQVTFKNVAHSDQIELACHKYLEKLEKLYDRIVSCHVVVSPREGGPTNVQLHKYLLTLHVPGSEIVISHHSGEVFTAEGDRRALHETFDRAFHRLEAFLERRRDRAKQRC